MSKFQRSGSTKTLTGLRAVNRELEERLLDYKRTCHKWHEGHVEYFDDLDGRGYVRDSSGNRYFLHYSAIETDQKHKTISARTEVKFQLHELPGETIVRRLKELK